jgi:hypothetical protein
MSMCLGKLGELCLLLVAQRLDLESELGLGVKTGTGLLDLLLEIPDHLWVESLNQDVELGELLLDDSRRGGRAIGLEVVGRSDNGRDCLYYQLLWPIA